MLKDYLGTVILAINAQANVLDEPINKAYDIALKVILSLVGLVLLFKFSKHLFSSQPDWVGMGWELVGVMICIIGIIYGPDLIKSLIPGLPA